MDTAQTNQPQTNAHANTQPAPVSEKYLIAFVIQGDDVFKITADNIIHTTGTADGPAFDAIAKLKAAAALLELTNRHKERPHELRKMARELAGEGMKLMAAASASIRPTPAPAPTATPAPDDPPVNSPAIQSQNESTLSAAPAQATQPAAPSPVSSSLSIDRNSRIALISS